MDPVLEVRPSACLFLLGPQLTRRESERMSYRSVLEAGFTFLQQQRRRKRGTGYILDLEELRKMDVVPAMQRVIGLLRKEGLHKEWLRRTFGGSRLQSFDFPDSLQWMLELQQMGAMLVCTQYDTLLDDMAGQSPVTLCSDDPRFVKWLEIGKQHCSRRESVQTTEQSQDDAGRSLVVDLSGSKKYGILHLHGVHTKLESISLLPYSSVTLKNSSTSGRSDESEDGRDGSCVKDVGECLEKDHLASLRSIFHNKLVLMIGFDGDCHDPLLPSLLRVIYPEKNLHNLKNPPILITSSPPSSSSSSLTQDLVLQLQLRSLENLRDVLVPGSSSNFTIGREHIEVSKNPPQAFLLFNEKQSFRKLGEIIYQQSKSGEIYVCRDALTVIFDHTKILYGNLVTYAGNGLRQLWELVFAKDSMLEAKGLLGVGLQKSVIVWLNKKPKGITNITGINSVHTNAAHKAMHTMALAQRPLSTSSTSSVDSFSDSRSPPYTPVSSTAQMVGSQLPPTSSHHSIPTPRKKDRRGGGGNSFMSSSSFASSAAVVRNSSHSGSSTSLSPLLSAPVVPPSLPSFFNPSVLQREVALNHLSSKLLTASPTSILNPFPFSNSALTPTPISISQISGSQSILPSLPFLIPPVVSDVPKFPPVTSVSYLYPHTVNPADLEKLTNLNRQLSSQLQATTHAVSPVAANADVNTQMEASLATSRLMEWKGVVDSAPPVTKEFTHCVAGPAEVLQLLASYQEHMKTVLAESEHKIERIDTLGIHRNSEKNMHGTEIMAKAIGSVCTTTIAGNSVNTISPPRTKLHTHTAHHLSLTRDSSLTAVPSSSVTPSVSTLEVPSLPANYPSSLLGTLAFSQPNLTGSIITSGNNLLSSGVPLLFQTHQTFGLIQNSPRPPTLNYCILPHTLQQISGTSRSNTSSSPPTGISMTNATATTAAASPHLPQSALIAGVPMPQAGEVLLNNMAGGMNLCYLVHTLPAIPSAVQPLPAPTTATILQVDPPATLMLQGTRPMERSFTARQMDQSANNLTQARLRNSSNSSSGSRIGITDGTNAEKVSLKRTRCVDLPDCMGEKILKLVNPSAVAPPFSSPSKYSSAVANQNHPRWSGDLPGRSVSDVAEVAKHVPQGPFKDSSSSESEESTHSHKSSKRRQE